MVIEATSTVNCPVRGLMTATECYTMWNGNPCASIGKKIRKELLNRRK